VFERFIMEYKRVRGTIFCRITNVLLTRIKKHRKLNLAQLKRILCLEFGSNYFSKRNHMHILFNVIEYLLYTKRISISPSIKEQHNNNCTETEITVNNNHGRTTTYYSKFIVLFFIHNNSINCR